MEKTVPLPNLALSGPTDANKKGQLVEVQRAKGAGIPLTADELTYSGYGQIVSG